MTFTTPMPTTCPRDSLYRRQAIIKNSSVQPCRWKSKKVVRISPDTDDKSWAKGRRKWFSRKKFYLLLKKDFSSIYKQSISTTYHQDTLTYYDDLSRGKVGNDFFSILAIAATCRLYRSKLFLQLGLMLTTCHRYSLIFNIFHKLCYIYQTCFLKQIQTICNIMSHTI